MAEGGIEVWRGGVNTWECDEMGHLNVRYYVAIAMEGLAGFCVRVGLPGAFRTGAGASLVVREHHIRYLREARSRAALHMTCGLVSMGESDAVILQVLTHSLTGEPCASFLTRVEHVTAKEMRPFPWPARVREEAGRWNSAIPDFAAPKGILTGPPKQEPSLETAEAIGLMRLSAGVIGPRDLDAFGRMEPHHFIGRVSDSVLRIVGPFREAVVDHADERPQNVGGAVLEYRVVYLDWPRGGDLFDIRSGVSGVDGRRQGMAHWMLDPVSGRAWGMAEAAVVTFDLDKRKIVPISDAAQAVIRERVKPQLGFAA